MRTKSIVLDLRALEQARENLEQNGCQVETAPPQMLECGVVLVAFREADGEGFLLSGPEVQLVARYGLAALDPHREDDQRPRWQREGSKNRVEAYIEAALSRVVHEVQTAVPGTRNSTLSRAAYALGGLEHLGLDRERAQQALEEAALSVGLSLQEARATIRRGLEAGARQPRELPGFGYSDTAGYQAGIQNKPAARRETPYFGYSDTDIPSLGDGCPPKLKGGR